MSTIIKGRIPDHSLLRDQSEGYVPFDITFKIIENGDLNEESGGGSIIQAHKLILASHSPVFKKMFYGSLKETGDTIIVKDTTILAFEKLIEYVYQVDIDCKEITVRELFDLVNLAERYEVVKLIDELRLQMEIVPLTMSNLMEVASIGCKFSPLFETTSASLLMYCAKFFQSNFKSAAEQNQFVLEQYDKGLGLVALELLKLAKTLPPPLICENCEDETCLSGSVVSPSKLKKGLRVKSNQAAQYFVGAETEAAMIVQSVLYNGVVELSGGDSSLYYSTWHGVPTLCYNC